GRREVDRPPASYGNTDGEGDRKSDHEGDRGQVQMLAGAAHQLREVVADPGPVHRQTRTAAAAVSSAGTCRSGPTSRASSRNQSKIIPAVTSPRTLPCRSTTIPAWTSASRRIDNASLSVVRRLRSGD